MSWLRDYQKEVRVARSIARRTGHSMGRLNVGDHTAVTSCGNYDCHLMLEIQPSVRQPYRFIALKGPTGSMKCPVGARKTKEASE